MSLVSNTKRCLTGHSYQPSDKVIIWQRFFFWAKKCFYEGQFVCKGADKILNIEIKKKKKKMGFDIQRFPSGVDEELTCM